MALAPKTVLTYPLDGANRDFVIPFEYLARKFVQVTLIGQDRKLLTINIDYRFTQRTIITLTKNWGPADGYERIEIRRYTSATERLVDFSDGSILRAYDLNTSQIQSLHIAEEGRDVASDTIGVNNDGDLDARGRKIVNLADATSDGEAVTLRQQKTWAGSALSHANRAEERANHANNQAISAQGAAQRAQASQLAAKASQDAALASRNEAESKAIASGGSAALARRWASEDLDVIVADGKYSALTYNIHSMRYSQESQRSAQAALGSQQAALGSQQAAAQSAKEAAQSAAEVKLPVAGPNTALRVLSQNTAGTKIMYSDLRIPLELNEVGTKFLRAGSFGLGGAAFPLQGRNADDYIPTGLYYMSAGTNTPYPYGWLRTNAITPGTYDFQEAFDTTGKMQHRAQSGGKWGPWQPIRYGVYSVTIEGFLKTQSPEAARAAIGAAVKGRVRPTPPELVWSGNNTATGAIQGEFYPGDILSCVVSDGSHTGAAILTPHPDGSARGSALWGNSGFVAFSINAAGTQLNWTTLAGYSINHIYRAVTTLT